MDFGNFAGVKGRGGGVTFVTSPLGGHVSGGHFRVTE